MFCRYGAEVSNVAPVSTEVTGVVVKASQAINNVVEGEMQVVAFVTIFSQLHYFCRIMIRLCNSWVKSFIVTDDVSM